MLPRDIKDKVRERLLENIRDMKAWREYTEGKNIEEMDCADIAYFLNQQNGTQKLSHHKETIDIQKIEEENLRILSRW